MPKARIAPARPLISRARSRRPNPAPTAISGPMSRSRDGEVVDGDGWTLEAMTTPGTSRQPYGLCAGGSANVSFVGDHVMGWSTSIVAPPDGSMSDYMASLDKLAQRDEQLYFSGHGPAIPEGAALCALSDPPPPGARGLDPAPARQGRGRHPDHGAGDLYRHRSAADRRAAGYSVLAHLEDLVARGVVATDGDPVIGGTYRLVSRLRMARAHSGIRPPVSLLAIRQSATRRLTSSVFACALAGACGFFAPAWRCRRRC